MNKIEFYGVKGKDLQKLNFIRLLKYECRDVNGNLLGLIEAKDIADNICDGKRKIVIVTDPSKVNFVLNESEDFGFLGRGGRKNKLSSFLANTRKEEFLKEFLKEIYNIDKQDIDFVEKDDQIIISYEAEVIEISLLDIMAWMYSKIKPNGNQ